MFNRLYVGGIHCRLDRFYVYIAKILRFIIIHFSLDFRRGYKPQREFVCLCLPPWAQVHLPAARFFLSSSPDSHNGRDRRYERGYGP